MLEKLLVVLELLIVDCIKLIEMVIKVRVKVMLIVVKCVVEVIVEESY